MILWFYQFVDSTRFKQSDEMQLPIMWEAEKELWDC